MGRYVETGICIVDKILDPTRRICTNPADPGTYHIKNEVLREKKIVVFIATSLPSLSFPSHIGREKLMRQKFCKFCSKESGIFNPDSFIISLEIRLRVKT